MFLYDPCLFVCFIAPLGTPFPLEKHLLNLSRSFSQGSLTAQTVKNLPVMQVTYVRSLRQEVPLKKEMATHSSIPAGTPHGQRRLAGYSLCCCKKSDTTDQLNRAQCLS